MRERIVKGSNPLEKIAHYIGTTVNEEGLVAIPPALGRGFVRGFPLGKHIAVIYCDFELNEEILIEEEVSGEDLSNVRRTSSYLLFQFVGCLATELETYSQRAVQITTMDIDMERKLLSQRRRADLYLTIDATLLRDVVDYSVSPILKSIILNECPLFFENSINKRVQTIVMELVDCKVPQPLRHYYLKSKVDELVCSLLIELSERDLKRPYPINRIDLEKVYAVREHLLANFAQAPSIKELAREVAMSESKLSKLFKQVFGESIFSYYEVHRIEHAAMELREGMKSVSEVGYDHGFSNLSHFARLFERIIGMKPKAYSKSLSKNNDNS